MGKIKLNRFIGYPHKISLRSFMGFESGPEFGDFILFQEYTSDYEKELKISRPILAIYLGCFVCDQTLGFNYVPWVHERRTEFGDPLEIKSHIEWYDYVDIIGHWRRKPTWKEIIKAYRLQNPMNTINPDDIDWEP